ncbi:unnamed protein product [Paramecium pentaurelia]|uniref:Cyclic nucleotide-binding domain-containing protein n=1 Tax=Paramecium pentaurelia TaxID=43138 RepID=A0A8S1U5X1_9CILI|nr:unnamed protein product [Paramecium pentaurelia]
MNPKQLFQDKYQQIRDFLLSSSDERNNEQLIDIRNILESFAFFIQFTNTKSQEFIEMCRYLQLEVYEQEQTLFRQGDPADKFYIILKGEARILIKSPGLDEIKQVGISGVGDCFGELALLFNSDRNATIVVGKQTELMVLHRNDFNKYMKFHSSEQANQAYNLLNVIEPFLSLNFPDKIRLASKMEYRTFQSNYAFINQGQTLNNFYVVETGSVKLYRTIPFNINKNGLIQFQHKYDPNKQSRNLKIEIDEIGPGKYIGDYELQHYKPSQYTAVTGMQTTCFVISLIDFNLMSQFQLAEVCRNSKPYPTDDHIREAFLDGIKWRIFRKQMVSKLQLELKTCSDVRDPTTLPKFQYQKDLRQFALKTLSYDKLMDSYLNSNGEPLQSQTVKVHKRKINHFLLMLMKQLENQNNLKAVVEARNKFFQKQILRLAQIFIIYQQRNDYQLLINKIKMNQISQNILVQKLIDYKLRKNKNKRKASPQYSPPKMPISQRQTSFSNGHAYSIHQKLKSIQSYATVSDLLDLLSQMFRLIQQYEQQASHLWSKNLEMLKQIKIPILQENEDLKLAVETLKQNDIQNSVYGQLKEYEQIEKPIPKLIDLQHINRDSNFQEEFMSKVNEFSLSWRQEVQQLKQL